jgi:hypothetical protein
LVKFSALPFVLKRPNGKLVIAEPDVRTELGKFVRPEAFPLVLKIKAGKFVSAVFVC